MNKFESVQCSKNDVRVCLMFDKMVFVPSLARSNEKTSSKFECKMSTIEHISPSLIWGQMQVDFLNEWQKIWSLMGLVTLSSLP